MIEGTHCHGMPTLVLEGTKGVPRNGVVCNNWFDRVEGPAGGKE